MALSWKIELTMRDIRILAHVAAKPGDVMAAGNYPGVDRDTVTPTRKLVATGLLRHCTDEETAAREAYNKANAKSWQHPPGDGRFHRLTLKGRMVVDLMRMDAEGLVANLFPSFEADTDTHSLPPEPS